MATDNPLDGKLVVLVGGSGFLGRHVAQDLLARGARLRIACRNPESAFTLKPLANLGQLQFARCDVTKPESLKAVMAGADAATYLVGAFKGDLDRLHGTSAGQAAEAAKAEGAQSFVLVSAIGADPGSDSHYASSKGAGEQAVKRAFPKATILRPSVLFGEDDNFINLFAGLIATMPALPIFGPDAPMQPLWVDDAAACVANALADPSSHGGKTYEIAGPEVLTMGEINRKIAAAQQRERRFIEVPDAISAIFAALPLTPMSSDQWAMLKSGNTASARLPGTRDLGVSPKPLDLFLDKWMTRYRKHGRFGTKVGAVRR
ncbi:MAG TPA: complex I NDUFA9 subunit family protein [Sphingomonadaceae bacterium]|nr:complex I NDUFA9 subunit family protein [Sphingomonadaceae bacterium]